MDTDPARALSPAWWVAAALAVAAAAAFGYGVRRSQWAGAGGDFTTVYTASRAWAKGENPYDADLLVRAWFAARGSRSVIPNVRHTPSVYPPGTFALLAPLAMSMPWPATRLAWAGLNLAAIAAMLAALVSLAGLTWRDPPAMVLVAIVLALGPVRDGVIIGQPIVATTAALVLCAWAARGRRDVLAGVLLCVATVLKPQVAGPFAIYYLLRRRWTIGGLALGGLVAFELVGAARLSLAGVPWVHDLLANLHAAEAPGAVNDPTFHSGDRFALVNLQVLLHTVLDSRPLVSLLTAAVVAAGATAFAAAVLRRSPDAPDRSPAATSAGLPAAGLAELGFVAALALLPVYHRWHDAEPLVFALAWAAAAVASRRWAAAAIATVLLTLPFIASLALKFPGNRIVHGQPHRYGPLMEWVVLPNQCWCAIGLCAVLLLALWWRPRDRAAG